MTTTTDEKLYPYIVWVDYGLSGWQPHEFETAEDALTALAMGIGNGNKIIITRRLNLTITELPNDHND